MKRGVESGNGLARHIYYGDNTNPAQKFKSFNTLRWNIFQLSWIRLSDMSLLAVGGYTYTSDLRVESQHEVGSADWLVVIRNLSIQDSGQYECQVSTTPHMSLLLNLHVRGNQSYFSCRY